MMRLYVASAEMRISLSALGSNTLRRLANSRSRERHAPEDGLLVDAEGLGEGHLVLGPIRARGVLDGLGVELMLQRSGVRDNDVVGRGVVGGHFKGGQGEIREIRERVKAGLRKAYKAGQVIAIHNLIDVSFDKKQEYLQKSLLLEDLRTISKAYDVEGWLGTEPSLEEKRLGKGENSLELYIHHPGIPSMYMYPKAIAKHP